MEPGCSVVLQAAGHVWHNRDLLSTQSGLLFHHSLAEGSHGATLKHTSDGGPHGPARIAQVVGRKLDSTPLLCLAGIDPDVHENCVAAVQDVGIGGTKNLHVDIGVSTANLLDHQTAGVVTQLESNLLELLNLGVIGGLHKLILGGNGISAKQSPEGLVFLAAIQDHALGALVSLINQTKPDVAALVLLSNTGTRSVPLVDSQASVQDESVAFVE
mmetsp:Transcript_16838/g.18769  ORF Transcript_16838/g.18769 Transcript_16838/m.18769 type:complete len:215 (-) Transcript_16838:890-1534(-)